MAWEVGRSRQFPCFSLLDVLLLIGLGERIRAVLNAFGHVVSLLIKKVAADLYIARIGVKCYMSTRIWESLHKGWYQSVLLCIHGLKFFAIKQCKCFWVDYLWLLVQRRRETHEVGYESSQDGYSSLRTACIVCDASFELLRQTTWPRKSIVLVKKLRFLSLRVALALYRGKRTFGKWSV